MRCSLISLIALSVSALPIASPIDQNKIDSDGMPVTSSIMDKLAAAAKPHQGDPSYTNPVSQPDSPATVPVTVPPADTTASDSANNTAANATATQPDKAPSKDPTTDSPTQAPVKDPSKDPAATVPVTAPPADATASDPANNTAANAMATQPANDHSKDPPVTEPVKDPTKSPPVTEPVKDPTKSPPVTEPVKDPTKDPPAKEPVKNPTKDPPAKDPPANVTAPARNLTSILSTTDIESVLASIKNQSVITIPADARKIIAVLGKGGLHPTDLPSNTSALTTCANTARDLNAPLRKNSGTTGSPGNVAWTTNKVTLKACESAQEQISGRGDDGNIKTFLTSVGILNANLDRVEKSKAKTKSKGSKSKEKPKRWWALFDQSHSG